MTDESQNQPPEIPTVNSVQAADAQELSPEQIEFFRKLETIFMPYATRQRAEAYRTQGKSIEDKLPIRLVHYTSAEAALSIINSKCIWMRNATCMADYQEVEHGFKILHSFFSDGANNPLIRALDACAPGAAKTFDFDELVLMVSSTSGSESQRLPLWNGLTCRKGMTFARILKGHASSVLNAGLSSNQK
jgi:hypothetical protein